jgi:hypothetical protein
VILRPKITVILFGCPMVRLASSSRWPSASRAARRWKIRLSQYSTWAKNRRCWQPARRRSWSVGREDLSVLEESAADEVRRLPRVSGADRCLRGIGLLQVLLDEAVALQRGVAATRDGVGFTSGATGFKIDKPPFNDIRVRRALSGATSLSEIFESNAYSQGHWVPNPAVPAASAEWSIPIDQLGPEGRKLYEYSSADAKRLLAEAG